MSALLLFKRQHPPLTARWLATLIRAWKRCQITFKSLWMPELLLPNLPRLFNLTVLLRAQDKMVNPCSGGLSERSTHSLEYGISLQIPPAHFRCDPITARICVFHFLPLPHWHVIRIKKKKPLEEVFLKPLEINVFSHSFVPWFL